MASNGFIAFMQGRHRCRIVRQLRRPGAPTEFIDSRTVEEYLASGECQFLPRSAKKARFEQEHN
jgi:hypothetical protein